MERKFITNNDTGGLSYEKNNQKCLNWLTEYMTANDMSLTELDELCWEDSDWVFDQIFN